MAPRDDKAFWEKQFGSGAFSKFWKAQSEKRKCRNWRVFPQSETMAPFRVGKSFTKSGDYAKDERLLPTWPIDSRFCRSCYEWQSLRNEEDRIQLIHGSFQFLSCLFLASFSLDTFSCMWTRGCASVCNHCFNCLRAVSFPQATMKVIEEFFLILR